MNVRCKQCVVLDKSCTFYFLVNRVDGDKTNLTRFAIQNTFTRVWGKAIGLITNISLANGFQFKESPMNAIHE